MADMAQIDKIIAEVNELEEKEKILFFHKIEAIFDRGFDHFNEAPYDEIPIESVFGLWKDRNITKETIRKKAWIKH